MRLLFLILAFAGLSFSQKGRAQNPLTVKVGVFAPIYIDSAFSDNNYKLGNTISKNILPGLDFYNGVMMAIDSLNAEGVHAEVFFYDTKNSNEPLQYILEKPELAGLSLIIAFFNTRNEIKPLADFALANKIPLISETYPNDGGITENPYFVLINPTLKTHANAIYKYLQRTNATNNIVWVKRKGSMEDMIQSQFSENNKKTPALPLRLKTIELVDSFNTADLISSLDSNRQNTIICGTLNENFSVAVIKTISANRDYHVQVIGMPTWDGLKDLTRPELKGVEVIYSSPYNFSRTDKLAVSITNKYRNKFLSRPSDQVFKGYESLYHFTKLAIKHRENLIHNLSDKSFKVFNDFDIQPVKFKKENWQPDYQENRKLYFIKKVDGQIKQVF
jgi:ABC-type branched-subunit amino acid transport system substrate-binding protein